MLGPVLLDAPRLLAAHPPGQDGIVLLPPLLFFLLAVAFLIVGPIIGAATVGLLVAAVELMRRLGGEQPKLRERGSKAASASGRRGRGRRGHRSPQARRPRRP